MNLDLFLFCLALVLTAVVALLYVTGKLEFAIEALKTPPPLNEQEQAEARERAERWVSRLFAPLDRFADRPGVRRIAESRAYQRWINPILTGLYIAFNVALIVAALFGYLHWSTGVLAFGILLVYFTIWRVMWLAANSKEEDSPSQ